MYLLRKITKVISFFLIITSIDYIECSINDRIHLEKNRISVIYEHQLHGGNNGFQHIIDISPFSSLEAVNCSADDTAYCLQWGSLGTLRITKKCDKCYIYEFTTTTESPLIATFDTSNVHLFGGAEHDYPAWPAEKLNQQKYSYVSKDDNVHAVVEPYWLVSNGMYLYVHDETPLFITQNERQKLFQLIAERSAPYNKGKTTHLTYTLCKLRSMKSAHKHAIANVLGKPKSIPDRRMVRYPIWSTWALYKENINQVLVTDFATKIAQHGFPNSHLEIDDRWESCYGSMSVDLRAFPNMKWLVENLKRMGFRVTIWAHPFVNVDCIRLHAEGVRLGYFVRNENGSVITSWWHGPASYVDFTNPDAAQWYVKRLNALLQETGIDSFKFDAGESSWMPQVPVYQQMKLDHPETIVKAYVDTVSKFGGMVEVRSGRRTQEYPVFVRMIDRDTDWESRVGLRTLIPCLLQMNLAGFPFVLPDMIAGNVNKNEIVTEELFVRWLQINTFMPSLQFSYPPWLLSSKVVEITNKFVKLHEKHADEIISLMEEATRTGVPVNRPIWWIDPFDTETYFIDDEFLLGEDLLVAPIVKQGTYIRHIYLPKGVWEDETSNSTKSTVKGPIWLYNYEVPLDKLPHFRRVGNDQTTDEDENEEIKGKSVTSRSSSAFALGTTLLICYSFCIN